MQYVVVDGVVNAGVVLIVRTREPRSLERLPVCVCAVIVVCVGTAVNVDVVGVVVGGSFRSFGGIALVVVVVVVGATMVDGVVGSEVVVCVCVWM